MRYTTYSTAGEGVASAMRLNVGAAGGTMHTLYPWSRMTRYAPWDRARHGGLEATNRALAASVGVGYRGRANVHPDARRM